MGSIRTFDPEVRALVKQRLADITQGTVKTYRAEADLVFDSETAALSTDPATVRLMGDAMKQILGEDMVFDNLPPFSGSEDFAFVTQEVPSGFFAIGGAPEDWPALPQHNPKIRFHEDAFVSGVAAYVGGALAWLEASR